MMQPTDSAGISEEQERRVALSEQDIAAGKGSVHLLVGVPTSVQPSKVVVGDKRRRTDVAPPAIIEFGQQLDREADLTVGRLLKLPKAVFSTALCNGLYIRQEYWDLHNLIKTRMASRNWICRCLVLGSPGIGRFLECFCCSCS